jgi:excisionase family DNA binding protein
MTGTEWDLKPLLSVADLADYLGLPAATIYDLRSHGEGPVGHRIGKQVKFTLTDVRAWLDARREAPSPGSEDGSWIADASPATNVTPAQIARRVAATVRNCVYASRAQP